MVGVSGFRVCYQPQHYHVKGIYLCLVDPYPYPNHVFVSFCPDNDIYILSNHVLFDWFLSECWYIHYNIYIALSIYIYIIYIYISLRYYHIPTSHTGSSWLQTPMTIMTHLPTPRQQLPRRLGLRWRASARGDWNWRYSKLDGYLGSWRDSIDCSNVLWLPSGKLTYLWKITIFNG